MAFIHPVIEPVITDRKGGAHFGGIEKVPRIPVCEITRCFQLCVASLRVSFIAENMVCHRQCSDTALDPFGCFKQADAVGDLILADRRIKDSVCFAAQLFDQNGSDGIIADMRFQFRKFLLRHDDARMRVHSVFFDHVADHLFAVSEIAVILRSGTV